MTGPYPSHAAKEAAAKILAAAGRFDEVTPTGQQPVFAILAAGLYEVAAQFRERGKALTEQRKKGHVSIRTRLDYAADEVDGVAKVIEREGAELLLRYAASEVAGVAVSLQQAAGVPVRIDCAGRVDQGEWLGALPCALEKGHGGDHSAAAVTLPKGACGMIGPGETACTEPVNHEGDHGNEQYNGSWPRVDELVDDYPGQCAATSIGQRCMLSGGHTGTHIDKRGGRWPQTAKELTARVAKAVPGIIEELTGVGPIGIVAVPAQRVSAEVLPPAEAVMVEQLATAFDLPVGVIMGEGFAVIESPPTVALAEIFGEKGAAVLAQHGVVDEAPKGILTVPSPPLPEMPLAESILVARDALLANDTYRDAGGMDAVGSPPFPGDVGYCGPCDAGGHTCQGCGGSTTHEAPYACSDITCPGHPAYREPRGCAAETCGGSSLDPCYSSMTSSNREHDGDIARPGLDEQCRAVRASDGVNCLALAGHKGNHTDGVSGWVPDVLDDMVASPDVDWTQDCGAEISYVAGRVDGPCRLPRSHGGDHSLNTYAQLKAIPPPLPKESPVQPDPTPPVRTITGPIKLHSVSLVTDPLPGYEIADVTPVLAPQFTITGAVAEPGIDATAIDLWNAPGSPKPFQSPSSVDTMAECGLKYRFQYRDKLKQTPAWWNVGGTAFHSYAEGVERTLFGEKSGRVASILDKLASGTANAFQVYFLAEMSKLADESGVSPERWRTASKGKEDRAFWEAEGPNMASRYLLHRLEWGKRHVLAALPDGSPLLERKFRTAIGGVPVEGQIDSAWWRMPASGDEALKLVIKDWKAGSRKPTSPFQVATYRVGAASLLPFGTDDAMGVYYMARKGEIVEKEPDRSWSIDSLAYRYRTTAAADAAGQFIAKPSDFCVACPFKRACPAVGA